MLHCQHIAGARDRLVIGARPAAPGRPEIRTDTPTLTQGRSAHDAWAIAQAAASKAEFDLHHAQMVAIETGGLPVDDERAAIARALRARATVLLNAVLAELARDPGRPDDCVRDRRDG